MLDNNINQNNNTNAAARGSKYAGVSAAVNQNINNNSSSVRTQNNNLIVNSNSSASFSHNRGGSGASEARTDRIVDYNNYYETNNNAEVVTGTIAAPGESKYVLANGHNSVDEVSSTAVWGFSQFPPSARDVTKCNRMCLCRS